MTAAALLVALSTSVPLDMRYAGPDNFTGRPVPGYEAPLCLLTPEAAAAVAGVQRDLERKGLSLLVHDCFRPQRAVAAFAAWAKAPADPVLEKRWHPRVAKSRLFAEGYIAEKSSHSRGSTVDVTLKGADMGTPWDFFDPRSHAASEDVPAAARRNRRLLKAAMEKRGFKGLKEEWWHFTLAKEPHASALDGDVE